MGKSSTKAKNKYESTHYDRIPLIVPKGKKDFYSNCAIAEGKSLNQFLIDRIDKGLFIPPHLTRRSERKNME